ncbi:MAG TPA: ATP-binding protein, partial [Nitrolancea sp.]|nr:ATP-binding protein [Nitrolancea sp.]
MSSEEIRTRLRVAPEKLRRRMDPDELPFQTTAEVVPLDGTIGQPRAIDAIEFGLEIESHGYNLFLSGSPGSGRESTILDFLKDLARQQPPPSDWVYVHNFVDPDQPRSIELPAGLGTRFSQDMRDFVIAAQREIPRAFESEEYAGRRGAALNGFTQQRDAILNELQNFAQARSFSIEMTPTGIVTVPVVDGKPIDAEAFEKLEDEQKQQIAAHGQEVQAELGNALRALRDIEKQASLRANELDSEIATFVVGPFLNELREHYTLNPKVVAYLNEVQKDIPIHLHDFAPTPIDPAQQQALSTAQFQAQQREEHLARYNVNILIDNSQTTGAPVVFERNPTYYNLNGRIDYRAAMGSMLTDFNQIKPGALHRANGGFLVLHAAEVL